MKKILSELEILLIKSYRVVSKPIYLVLDKAHINPISCRFNPSCSQYALDAINKYGPYKGAFMAAKRILRCRPPYGGNDPVK